MEQLIPHFLVISSHRSGTFIRLVASTFLPSFLSNLIPIQPTTLSDRYTECGRTAAPDSEGFHHVFTTPGSLGREISISDIIGNWFFSRSSLITPTAVSDASDSGWRWPLVTSTSNAPSIGGRISILGGSSCFREIGFADDGFANDALWRATPLQLWRGILTHALVHTDPVSCIDVIVSTPSPTGHHTGMRERYQIQRSSVAIRKRRIRTNTKCLKNITRNHALRQKGGRRVELAPGGAVGRASIRTTTRYPAAKAHSLGSSLMGEDFPGNSTWVDSIRNRITTRDLSVYVPFAGRRLHRFELTYKRAWYADRSFSQGLCNFHGIPFLYELTRRIIANDLDYRHLFAPAWLTD